MTDSRSEMVAQEGRVAELERALSRLSDYGHDLEERILRLGIVKSADPQDPYWDWLLPRRVSRKARLARGHVLAALDGRAAAQGTPHGEEAIDRVGLTPAALRLDALSLEFSVNRKPLELVPETEPRAHLTTVWSPCPSIRWSRDSSRSAPPARIAGIARIEVPTRSSTASLDVPANSTFILVGVSLARNAMGIWSITRGRAWGPRVSPSSPPGTLATMILGRPGRRASRLRCVR